MGTDVPVFVGDGEAPARRVRLSSYYLVRDLAWAMYRHVIDFMILFDIGKLGGMNLVIKMRKKCRL